MYEIKIPGVEIIVKSIPNGTIAYHEYPNVKTIPNYIDGSNDIRISSYKRLHPEEFHIAAVVHVNDEMKEILKQAYKLLGIKILEKYMKDTSVDTITVGIRVDSWDTAFSYFRNKSSDNVLGIFEGTFSISAIDSKKVA